MSQHDDHDDLAALDFSAHEPDSDDYGVADSDALDFSVADGTDDEAPADAFDDYATPGPEELETELDAIAAVTEATGEDGEEETEEDRLQLFSVTNPADTVSVSALIDGRTQRVQLSPKATSMSESEIASEILVLADLARQKGLAGQHTFLLENEVLSGIMRDVGIGGTENLLDFMEHGMGMPTPQQAEAAQAEVFATRYATDHD